MTVEQLKTYIRDVPDFPKPGIMFKDITPLLANGPAFKHTTDLLAERVREYRPDVLVGIESRGFIFGAALAHQMGLGLLPVRKPGKLPWKKRKVEYALEYGTDALEMHEDALLAGQRVVIVDDLLATGGTAAAAVHLVRELGATLAGAAFVVELTGLNGRGRLGDLPIDALISYP